MRSIAELVPDVTVAAAGAPKIVVIHALSRALSDFLYRTEAWKEWSLDIDTDEIDDGEYTWLNHLDPDDPDAEDFDWLRVKRVQSIKFGTATLHPVLPTKLAERDPDWKSTTGVPRMFVSLSDEGGGVRFYPAQETALPETMSARLVMITEATTGIGSGGLNSLIPQLPDRIFRKYRETLVDGALAILYSIPGRDWTSHQLSAQKRASFDDAIVLAESSAARDENYSQITVAFNPDW